MIDFDRTAASGDQANDGRFDDTSHHFEPVVLFQVTVPTNRPWLGVEMVGKVRTCVVGGRLPVDRDWILPEGEKEAR